MRKEECEDGTGKKRKGRRGLGGKIKENVGDGERIERGRQGRVNGELEGRKCISDVMGRSGY